jgi:hypothetical protein
MRARMRHTPFLIWAFARFGSSGQLTRAKAVARQKIEISSAFPERVLAEVLAPRLLLLGWGHLAERGRGGLGTKVHTHIWTRLLA